MKNIPAFGIAAFFFLLLLRAGLYAPIRAQSPEGEMGYFPFKNYSHEVYKAHHQNWFITQDKRGFIYAGNGDGILEFDGTSWRLISHPGLQTVRTVVVDDNNTKWVGADRDLGFLQADSVGNLRFQSLKNKIPESHRLNANIWQIFPVKERILFVTDRTIYCWQNNEFTIIPSPGPIFREYQIEGEVYFSISGKGMFKLAGDSLRLIPDGQKLIGLKPVVALPYGRSSLLFATIDSGLYLHNGNSLRKMENELGNYLGENNLYAGRRLPDSSYAFTTLNAGVVLMDEQGRRLREITTEAGILNNQVYGLTVDKGHALWLALQTGISRVDLQLPYTLFDSRAGLEGTISTMARHKGKLYVGTFSGLYSLEMAEGRQPAKFRRIEDIPVGCFSLLSVGNHLLAGTANGTFLIEEKGVSHLNKLAGNRVLYASGKDAKRVFAGHMHGLSTLYLEEGQWVNEAHIEQIGDDIFTIAADEEGTLWLGTSLQGVIELNLPETGSMRSGFNPIRLHRYMKGLPEGTTKAYYINGELLLTAEVPTAPLFKLDKARGIFEPYADFGKEFGIDSLIVYPIASQYEGHHIMLESQSVEGRQYRFSATRQHADKYRLKRFHDEGIRSTTDTRLYWEDENLVWLGGETLARYDFEKEKNFEMPFKAYIRKVSAGQDSILFGGAETTSGLNNVRLPFTNGGLRFEFASPAVMASDATRYRYILEGTDSEWSDWSEESRKDYTHLPEGSYQFRVQAQNIYGQRSEADMYAFQILPPWYRSWGAYMLYLTLVATFLWALLKWRAHRLIKENEALEQVVAMRTAEVQHQANQLKIQAEKLRELDKAKSRFFANISHEFRTPLTLIKGPIEQLDSNYENSLSADTIKMIRRNANRLLQMVNQLLDLSKIDEGSLKLSLTEGDIYKCLRAAAASFNSHAAQRVIDYRVQIPQMVLWASFDREKLENIVYNLLGNAFKFSEDGAAITFNAFFKDSELHIYVSDTGMGIPQEKLPYIFERFYQVDSSTTKEKQGSGIGLSLSRDLVSLMEGTITVSSELSKGTLFKLKIPVEEIRTGEKEIPVPQIETPIKRPYALTRPDKRTVPTILLVEDNKDMRHYISELLISSYRVKEAINGEAGFKAAIKDPPDLIITDLMMPKLDGIELCKRLKKEVHTSHIPLIMLTAKAGIDNKLEGLETGADDYLTKPFKAEELLVRTKNLIEQRQQLRVFYSGKQMPIDPKKITVTSIDQKFLEQVLDLLEEEFSNPEFGPPQMQKVLAMSKTQFHRKLRALTNESPGELLRNFRLKRAAQLLLQKEDTITQIAYKVGFNNLSYFAKCFKELFGVAPSSY